MVPSHSPGEPGRACCCCCCAPSVIWNPKTQHLPRPCPVPQGGLALPFVWLMPSHHPGCCYCNHGTAYLRNILSFSPSLLHINLFPCFFRQAKQPSININISAASTTSTSSLPPDLPPLLSSSPSVSVPLLYHELRSSVMQPQPVNSSLHNSSLHNFVANRSFFCSRHLQDSYFEHVTPWYNFRVLSSVAALC